MNRLDPSEHLIRSIYEQTAGQLKTAPPHAVVAVISALLGDLLVITPANYQALVLTDVIARAARRLDGDLAAKGRTPAG